MTQNPVAKLVAALFALALIAVATLPALADRTVGSLTALAVAVVAVIVPMAAVLATQRTRPVPLVIWVMALPAAVVLLRSLTAAPFGYSLVGLRTIPQGASVWLIAWIWLAAFASAPQGTVARWTTSAVAVSGALSSAVGVWQRTSGSLEARSLAGWSSESTGLFTSSNALGQYTLLAIACGVTWYAISKTPAMRIAAGACTALSVVGLAVSYSRGSWAAAVIGIVVAWIASRPSKPVVTTSAIFGTGLAGSAALFMASAGLFGASVASRLDSVLAGRAVIWHRALIQWGRSLAFGDGPARFSTYSTWKTDPRFLDGVDAYGTFDPHSVVLQFSNTAGIVGLVALLAAVCSALYVLARGTAGGGRLPQVALIGGLTAWSAVQVIEIVEVVPLMTAAAIAGLLLSAYAPDKSPTKSPSHGVIRSRAEIAVAIAVGIAVAFPVVWAAGNASEYRQMEVAGTAITAAALDYWTRTGDPSYATDHLAALISAAAAGDQPELSEDAQMLATTLEPAADFYIDAARMSAFAWSLPSDQHPRGNEAKMREAVDAGREADPGNDELWDAVEAANAAVIKGWEAR